MVAFGSVTCQNPLPSATFVLKLTHEFRRFVVDCTTLVLFGVPTNLIVDTPALTTMFVALAGVGGVTASR